MAESLRLYFFLAAALCVACGGRTSASTPMPVDSGGRGTGGSATGGTGTGGATPEPFVNAFGCDAVAVDPVDLESARAAACTGISVECERVPGNLVFLVDRSATMAEPWGGSSRWRVALEGITRFLAGAPLVNATGLQVFSARGLGDAVDCNKQTYVVPVVASSPLAVAEPQIESALLARPPTGPATLGPALRGTLEYAEGSGATVVLVTSGATDACGSSTDALATRISSASVRTVVIGMGAGFEIDALAQAAGSRAFLIGEGEGPDRVIQALDAMLMGQGGGFCAPFSLPPAQPGQVIDPSSTRVFVGASAGSTEIPALGSETDCAHSPSGGWYPVPGAELNDIALCPCTCAFISCVHNLEILVPCE
jgi:hypothetical protein